VYKENGMKKILATLLAALSFTVSAQTIRAKNDAGGEIVLTTAKCTDKSLENTLLGYSYSKSGITLWFCFMFVDNDVLAVYLDDGTVRRYSIDMFYTTK
jgi:hypothetical protein